MDFKEIFALYPFFRGLFHKLENQFPLECFSRHLTTLAGLLLKNLPDIINLLKANLCQ